MRYADRCQHYRCCVLSRKIGSGPTTRLVATVQCVAQIVVQGLPWAYTSEELSGLFSEYKPASAEVVFGRDGRSRVRAKSQHAPAAQLWPVAQKSLCRLLLWYFVDSTNDRQRRCRLRPKVRTGIGVRILSAGSTPFTAAILQGSRSHLRVPAHTHAVFQVHPVQGYGTVRFETPEAAQAAITAFHQTDLAGRTLAVRLDRYA